MIRSSTGWIVFSDLLSRSVSQSVRSASSENVSRIRLGFVRVITRPPRRPPRALANSWDAFAGRSSSMRAPRPGTSSPAACSRPTVSPPFASPVTSRRTSFARSRVIGRAMREENVTTRLSAPPSSRTLSSTRSAMNGRTSASTSIRAAVARRRRVAIRAPRARAAGAPPTEVRDPRLALGWLDRGHQSRLETRHEPFVEIGNRLRRPVARENDHPVPVCHVLEELKELLLGLPLAREELDVVDKETVDSVEPCAECGERSLPLCDRDVVHERLGRRVQDPCLPRSRAELVPDRMEEMRLPEPWTRRDEQRIVRLREVLRDRGGRSLGEPVALPGEERVERVLLDGGRGLVSSGRGAFDCPPGFVGGGGRLD